MPNPNDERWKSLCEQASQEQDPQRLMELVKEINTLLAGDAPKETTADNLRKPLKSVDAA